MVSGAARRDDVVPIAMNTSNFDSYWMAAALQLARMRF